MIGPEEFTAEFTKGRIYQNELCIPRLRERDRYWNALYEIATIKKRIPFDAADAATECIRIAKEAIEEARRS